MARAPHALRLPGRPRRRVAPLSDTARPVSTAPTLPALHARLRQEGHLRLDGDATRALLAPGGGLPDWDAFAASWADLAPDTYLADGGRYRRRRHAVYRLDAGGRYTLQPQQPHYQSLDYNPLHGGIERWFEPLAPATAASDSLATILAFCATAFCPLSPEARGFRVELHQFRIEARAGKAGLPTPEGLHRDGVDWVLVLLVRRHNIAQGVTAIQSPDGRDLGSFTLAQPGDAVLLDDRRVYHGVTAVLPLDPEQPAYRDVLVVTLRAE